MIFLHGDNTIHFSVVLNIYLLILNHYLSWLSFKIVRRSQLRNSCAKILFTSTNVGKNIVSKTIHKPLSPMTLLILWIRFTGKNDCQSSARSIYGFISLRLKRGLIKRGIIPNWQPSYLQLLTKSRHYQILLTVKQ